MYYLGHRTTKTWYPFERVVSNHQYQFSFPVLPQIHSHQAFIHTTPENSHLPSSPIKSIAKSNCQFSVFLFFDLSATFDAVNHSLFLEAFPSLNIQDTLFLFLWLLLLSFPGLFLLIFPISKRCSVLGFIFLIPLLCKSLGYLKQIHGFMFHLNTGGSQIYLSSWTSSMN